MVKVLFVCLGNICRSPLAEGVLKKLVKEKGLEDEIEVDSCGTSKYHIGEQPDERTIANAKSNGIELNHKARQFEKGDFRKFTYLITMDEANKNCIERIDETKEFTDKMMLMRFFDETDKNADVPDPYFGGADGFQKVYDIIDRSVNNLLDWLIKKHDLEVKA
ncbi:low molecular weight phosphotyrosine protein phosphatase [Fulvivirga sp. RKSG066]|uniref:low molecular weight protein-tyrosine-phosphatase n=1 Tax=Fulvivirga aurantia TaxID=2529383 RepID=UPI0012BC1D08|nr:low molecular weight protein-tyrosine-phosphatase [Fulvivirga aurantia]MTI22279.1 low molecular weight phosphotyrosine protein phosphatase [Fulvivirga aurantia]